ncbi:MAG TPA: folylpolyglutamate synthase/dihydrofolate synthase family protein [Acidimicrobiales bacterium]|nr:folylpolyglutamate synthase/dihydrofolate synthase family protein [Acidimicrobiales bacterium]
MTDEVGPFSPPAAGLNASIGEALAWLDRHINLEAIESGRAGRHALPTLERIAALLKVLGDPQASYPVVHITGTNGKGSTARMCSALLISAGLNPGLYTSPHLERINERMTVGGTAISDADLARELAAMAELEVFVGESATWFEIVTATAFSWFAEEAVDSAVVEVGLGGRFDATNVADARVAVVTNVELDHIDILGPTREQIASEKAGILKEGSSLVLGEQDAAIARIFEEEAAAVGATAVWRRGADFGAERNRPAVGGRVFDLYTPFGRYEDVYLPLFGAHQADNAACALAAAQALFGAVLGEEVIADAFASVTAPGRLEVVGRRPLVVLDGAHNAAGAQAAGAALREDFPGHRVVVVLGCLRGRDPAELLRGLGPELISTVVACTAPSPRAQPAAALAAAASDLGLATEECAEVAEALQRALELAGEDDLVLVTGSLYVVGAARTLLSK